MTRASTLLRGCLLTALAGLAVGQVASPANEGQPSDVRKLAATVSFDDGSEYSGVIDLQPTGGLRLAASDLDVAATIDLDVMTTLFLEPVVAHDARPIAAPAGQDVLTLLRRQLVRGRVVDVGEDGVTFVSERFGRLDVPIAECGDLLPPAVGDLGSALRPLWGPWIGTVASEKGIDVVDDALVLKKRGAVAARDCLEGGGAIEMKLAWRGEPEFRIHVGGDFRRDPPTGVTLQPWGRSLVLFSFDGERVDAVTTGAELVSDSSILVRLSVDDEFVRVMSLETADGNVLPVEEGIRRVERGGVVAVEALGREMRILSARVTALAAKDSAKELTRPVLAKELTAFDAAARELRIEQGSFSFDESMGIRLALANQRRALTLATPAAAHVRLTCVDGEAVECSSVEVTGDRLRVRPRWGQTDIDLAVADVWKLERARVRGQEWSGRGRMRVAGRPESGVKMSSLRLDELGGLTLRIYGFEDDVRLEAGSDFAIERDTPSGFAVPRSKYPHVLVLRSGQSIPALVARATEESYFVETPVFSGAREIPVASVKALLLDPKRALRQLGGPKVVNASRGSEKAGRGQRARERVVLGANGPGGAEAIEIVPNARGAQELRGARLERQVVRLEGIAQRAEANRMVVGQMVVGQRIQGRVRINGGGQAVRFEMRNGDLVQVGATDPSSATPQTRGSLSSERIERALLVPRSQSEDPGRHLFVARNDDLLRANLAGIDAKGKALLRGGAATAFDLPLDRLAAIVNVDPAAELSAESRDPDALWTLTVGPSERVHGGSVLIGEPRSADGGTIELEHGVLGRLTIDLDDVDRLRSGDSPTSARFPFADWVTRPMSEPDIDCEDER